MQSRQHQSDGARGAGRRRSRYVGDTPRLDVVGARDAGLTPVWINRRNLVWPDELEPPAHVIDSLDELLLVIDVVAPE